MGIKELFQKYLSDDISDKELSLLRKLVSDKDTFTELEGVIDAMLKEKIPELNHLDKTSMVNAIIKGDSMPSAKIRTLRPWLSYAAATLILLSLGAAYLFTKPYRASRGVTSNNGSKNTTIQPGTNRATLTLANGKIIALDSVSKGVVAKQEGSNAVKIDAGVLSYDALSGNDQAGITFNTIHTPRGGQYQIILADGSKVWLNSASSLHFPTRFPNEKREVHITGEAYFEVVADAARPFTVIANDVTTEVLGTSFNINAYQDEPTVRTTLVEGSVRVSNPYTSTIIKPGQQASLKNEKHNVRAVNTMHEIAWKNGFFEFHNTSIESIMRQLSRWYNLEVVYIGKVEQLFLATIPRDASISQVLRVLEYTDAVHFEVNGNTVTIRP